MTCFTPLHGYRSIKPSATGKFPVVFNRKLGYVDLPITVPCGQCSGCRLERSRQWAMRCCHEAQLHGSNCFITLTYSDDHLPLDRSLDVSVYQKFMKRLRKRFGAGIRFYHCGEYGEKFGRPHYHAILFGFDFPDKRLHNITKRGDRLYTSEALSDLWPFGHALIGDVTFESAAYVARYVMKKITGEMASEHYRFVDPVTGEVYDRKPEYNTMSRRPGIASDWFDKYSSDVYPSDFVVFRGKKMRPPKFYDGRFEIVSPEEFELLKRRRKADAAKCLDNNTSWRLAVREQVMLARIKTLHRSVDNDS